MSSDTIQAAMDSQTERNLESNSKGTNRPDESPWQHGSANKRKIPPKPDLELAIRKSTALVQTQKKLFFKPATPKQGTPAFKK